MSLGDSLIVQLTIIICHNFVKMQNFYVFTSDGFANTIHSILRIRFYLYIRYHCILENLILVSIINLPNYIYIYIYIYIVLMLIFFVKTCMWDTWKSSACWEDNCLWLLCKNNLITISTHIFTSQECKDFLPQRFSKFM